MRKFILALLVLSCSRAPAQTHKGAIAGRVIDSKTLEPVPAVHVILIERPSVGTASDTNGAFALHDLEVGTYSLRISAVGYAAHVLTNIVVTTGRATPLLVKLDESVIEMQEVTARASYFAREQSMSPISSNILDRAEVLRSPGGIQDVQRVAQNLPGVASSTDNINELIVRGGAPFENLTIMDHMEIPSINHYSNQFNSAGPINMVNADMIEDVKFSSGGYPAQYGDKTSSVMDLTVREGNRERPFASKTAMNMAGLGTLIEGGFGGGRGSYILSARYSMLEVVDALIGISAISLTAVPKYWDLQAKAAYDLSPSQKLTFNVLYGDSRINLAGDVTAKDEQRRSTIDSSSVQTLSPVTKQYAAGASLRSLMGGEGYSVLTLYSSGTSLDVDTREDFTVRVRGPEGEVLSHRLLNTQAVFSDHALESFLGLKYELFYQVGSHHALSAGAQIQTALRWTDDAFVAADTSRYDLDGSGTYRTGPVVSPPWLIHQELVFGEASKYFAYASDRVSVSPRLSFTAGVRYDHFTYSGAGALSPRVNVSYQVVPASSTISFAYGDYYQTQPLPYYADRQMAGYNKGLADMRATHFVLGYEQIFERGLKASLETYYKRYTGVAVQEQFIYSASDTFRSDRMRAAGERTAYGLELFIEQKQVEDVFGTLSVSLSRSEMKDPRVPPLVSEYPSDYDYPVIVTALAGKVVKGVRSWINDAPFYIKYPLFILPFSDEMEISFKFRFQTGRPYTPSEYVTWKQDREGGIKWSRGSWVRSMDENSARYPNYSRLDIQWLSRFYMKGWNINVFIALMNVLNTKNVFYLDRRSDGTVETVYQFSFFPVGGIEVEY
jgi:outer membrane receptor protein involved in Fe transport